jgi:hypothetical protein
MPKAMVSKMPGYLFSSYELISKIANPIVVLGPAAFQRIFDECVSLTGLNASALALPTRPPQVRQRRYQLYWSESTCVLVQKYKY